MTMAFDVDKHTLSRAVALYRQEMEDTPYETSIDNIIEKAFRLPNIVTDLQNHLISFRSVLKHLPLAQSCDIWPEYVVYSENSGLAGSVDLCMRDRQDPNHILIYDWKTCKRIFNNFYRNGKSVNQLTEYSCQLHTYANIIKDSSINCTFDLYVVNVTENDSCIYNTKDYRVCECRNIYKKVKIPLQNHENAE